MFLNTKKWNHRRSEVFLDRGLREVLTNPPIQRIDERIGLWVLKKAELFGISSIELCSLVNRDGPYPMMWREPVTSLVG
jgi:hypothetical protein